MDADAHLEARRPRRHWGVRKRATAVAVVALAAGLAIGGLVLLLLLESSLMAWTDAAARQEAGTIVTEIRDDDLEDAQQHLVDTARPGQYVQILHPDGSVAAASAPAVSRTAMTSLKPLPGEVITQRVSDLQLARDTDFLLVAMGSEVRGKSYVVAVAANVEAQTRTVTTVAWFILGAAPLLLLAVGLGVWLLVGRSLRQVEKIRGQVARINSRMLNERVHVPPTSDEIEALARTMNAMLDRLEQADREHRRFVSDASHELRSPLATLSAGLEIAAADPSGGTWEDMKDVLSGETARMRFLVEDLLTLAKTNDGGLRLVSADVDLDDVLDDEVRRLRATSSHHIEAQLDPARVSGDVLRLGQAVRNVLDNANRHAKSRISVSVRRTEDYAVITVDNDGPPVPEAERNMVFERFVRLDPSRARESGGSGLGLAIAAAIMAAHDGWIRTLEAPDGGCRFELALPVAGAAAPVQLDGVS